MPMHSIIDLLNEIRAQERPEIVNSIRPELDAIAAAANRGDHAVVATAGAAAADGAARLGADGTAHALYTTSQKALLG